MTRGICVNYAQHCPMFEVSVEAIEGDRCCECEQLLMHESGLTWKDAGEQYEPSEGPTGIAAFYSERHA